MVTFHVQSQILVFKLLYTEMKKPNTSKFRYNVCLVMILHIHMFTVLFMIQPTNIWFCHYEVQQNSTPQISPRRVLDMFYPIFCFQQTFWLNIRQSMSPLNNIYIFRRIFLHWKLKNRVEIKKSVKIKNWRMNFYGFFFSFFG